MKKLYSYFLVSRYNETQLIKEEFEIKEIDKDEFVYFSKNNIQLFSQVPLDKFIYGEHQGVNGYRMLTLTDYFNEEVKPLFLAHILPEREKTLKEMSQKMVKFAESTNSYITNPIKVL